MACGIYLTFTPYITAKNFIRALLHPNPARRLTAEQALSHTWLTSFAAPTEHDLCGLRENFDPRARWRNAIGAARAMSRFAKGNGANHNKQKDEQLALSSDDEDDKDKKSRGGSPGLPSSRVTPEPDSKRQQQQQHLLPPSADDRAPQGGLAGLVAKGARTSAPSSSSSSSPPMSVSDALNRAKAPAETEKAREGGARATTMTAMSQPRNTQEDDEDEEEEEVELRMPGSFDFGDHGGGGAGARGTPGADTVDPFDAVGVLGNLWRRMQVR